MRVTRRGCSECSEASRVRARAPEVRDASSVADETASSASSSASSSAAARGTGFVFFGFGFEFARSFARSRSRDSRDSRLRVVPRVNAFRIAFAWFASEPSDDAGRAMAKDLLDLSWLDAHVAELACAPTRPPLTLTLTPTTLTTREEDTRARAFALGLPGRAPALTTDVRFCTSCKHHLESEFFKPGRRTCSACLVVHRSRMRWKRRRQATGEETAHGEDAGAGARGPGRGRLGARARKGARVTKTRRANANGGDAERDVDSACDTSK